MPNLKKTELVQGQKYIWNMKKSDDALVRSISYDHNLSLPIAQVLYSRGYVDPEEIRSFLFVSKEQNVFDASLLKDASIAVDRIQKAIANKEKILIFGDYDVDGITSTSLLFLALSPLKAKINFHLPNRLKDGYGLSEKVVQQAYDNDYKLIITVDNGITAIKPALKAAELGVDLIITDHHRPHSEIPKALAVIDPNQDECNYPYKDMAGVGIAFKLIDLLYKKLDLKLPDKIYELLMLGSVADVVPLLGENRFWVKYGLNKINKVKSFAVQTLIQNSGLKKSVINSKDVGFMLAPQINALGRLDDPRDAVKFLISADNDDVLRVGRTLRKINEERKLVERKIFSDIEGAIVNKDIDLDKENIIVAANDKWPAGVIGLVAGRLMHDYGKPAFLFHASKGIVRGSCRSIPEFDIFEALSENKDLLLSFGGHSFAAGLKLKQKDLPELKARLEEKILREVGVEALKPKVRLDAFLSLSEANKKIMMDLEFLEPFGNKNEQPVFWINDVTLLSPPKLLKDKHLKCSVFSDGVVKPVIFFNRPDLFSVLNSIDDESFDIAAYVVKNEWNGRTSVELQGIDILLKRSSN